jgi:hypothetical protein
MHLEREREKKKIQEYLAVDRKTNLTFELRNMLRSTHSLIVGGECERVLC